MGSVSTQKKPWIMNAFAMTAPGHLAPGNCLPQALYLANMLTNISRAVAASFAANADSGALDQSSQISR